MKKNIITFSKSGASSSKIRNIKWNAESNLDNFTKSGQYYITGYRASGTDSLPISNIGEWHNISALLTVTDSGEADTQQRNRIVGQTLILSNRVGGETKIFTRSCNMVSGGGLWTAWSTVQGLREVGGVSPVDIASYTDSGLYSGAITDSELSTMPMMPGTTFLLVVINNYQLASLSGSSQVRACTQLMYVLPYSHNASLDGISKGSIYLRTGMRSATTGIYEWGDWNSYDNRLQLIEKQLVELNLSGDVKGVISDDGSIVTSINPQAPIMQEITMVLNILLEAHDGSDNIKSTMRQYVGTAVSEMVDEEDITIDEDNLLRLKNRSYSKGVGMGYVILRRGKSFASQVTAANTIYEIRYDFDLAGEEVAIPEGCTLKFEGGRLMNGTLCCTPSTSIFAAMYHIFVNINIIGQLTSTTAASEWFGAIGNDKYDDTSAIQTCLNVFGIVHLSPKRYKISKTIILPYRGRIVGEGTLCSDGGFNVIDLAFGCSVKDITINEKMSHCPLRLDVTQLNKSYSEYNIPGDLTPKITINNVRIIADNTFDNNNESTAIKLIADGSYLNETPTKGFSYLYADNISIIGGYEYGVYIDVTDKGSRPKGTPKSDYITDCVFKSINCNGWVRKGFFVGGGDTYEMGNVPTRIIFDGCTTQYLKDKNANDYFIKINTGDRISILNCHAWDFPFTTNEDENKIFRVDPNTTIGIVFDNTLIDYRNKIHYLDKDDNKVVPNGKRPVIINNTLSRTAASSWINLEDLIPLRNGEKIKEIEILSLQAGVYRISSSNNYGIFLNLPDSLFNAKGGFLYVDQLNGWCYVRFLPNTYFAKGSIYERYQYICYTTIFVNEENANTPLTWLAVNPFISRYDNISDFNVNAYQHVLGLVDGKIANRYYIGDGTSAVDAMGFIFTDNNLKDLPTINGSRNIGKPVFYNSKVPVWWNGNDWVNANGNPISCATSGITSNRPIDVEIGFQYYDTTLNKPIWWNGGIWVDASGVNV